MRIATIFLTIFLGLGLVGCSGIKITGEQLAEMNQATADAQMECYEWLEAEALETAAAIEGLTKDQQFMFLVMKSNNEMVMALMGADYNPCGGETNAYEMMARMHEADRELYGDIAGHGFGAIRLVGGIWASGWALGNVVDKATGDAITVSGENNTVTKTESTMTTKQIQASGQTTGDNNLNPSSEIEEVEEVEEGEKILGFNEDGSPICGPGFEKIGGHCVSPESMETAE